MTRQELADSVADYVATHRDYAAMSKRDVAKAAVDVLTGDYGAHLQYMEVAAQPTEGDDE